MFCPLFKIISGIYGYDSGDIYTSKDCEIGYLEQNTNFHSENTILEEVLEVFKDVIEMEKYLRPETLFSNKFEGYLNEEVDLTDENVKNLLVAISEYANTVIINFYYKTDKIR